MVMRKRTKNKEERKGHSVALNSTIILVLSYNRANKQITYDRLPQSLQQQALVVCSKEEETEYKKRGRSTLVSPYQGQGMAILRQWCLEWAANYPYAKLIMLDDDLTLCVRTQEGRILVSSEWGKAVQWLSTCLESYVHAALASRSYAWHSRKNHLINCKGIQAVAYRPQRIIDLGARFDLEVDPWFFMEDYHMTLQLLEKGYSNIVSLVYRYNCSPFNSSGGVSKFRNNKSMEIVAKALEKLHPKTVKAIQKSYKQSSRWDVAIKWNQI